MNFLAHLVLAPQTPEGLVGSIAPDMIRGPLPRDLAPAVAQAAAEHQYIDRLTDTHAAFYRTRDRLRDCIHPRLAGIVADVMFDHVLARGWAQWCEGTHAGYVGSAERQLLEQAAVMPADMRWRVRLMVDQHWLLSYASVAGIRDRLAQMSDRLTRRVGRPMSMVISERDFHRVYPAIADDFRVLWPDLIRSVSERRLNAAQRLAS